MTSLTTADHNQLLHVCVICPINYLIIQGVIYLIKSNSVDPLATCTVYCHDVVFFMYKIHASIPLIFLFT